MLKSANLPKDLLRALDLPDADIKSLHTGISETFLAAEKGSSRKIIVKTLLEARPGEYSPYGEMAWLSALAAKGVPCVQPYFSDDWQKNVIECEGRIFWVYKYVEGTEPDLTIEKYYASYGRILRNLHNASDTIALEVNDPKIQRPVYNADFLIRQFYQEIESSPIFDERNTNTLFNLADKILNNFPQDRGFIHGDFHMGNMLIKDEYITILDFDECGFGSRYYDIGTMHLHTLAKNNLAGWLGFLDGYGIDKKDTNIIYGSAARIFYLIGAIPRRIAIVPDLKDEAPNIVRRYVGFIEKILAGQDFGAGLN